MAVLIWAGAAISLLGLLGLIYCISAAIRAKRAGLSEDAMAKRLQGIVAMNMGALCLSALGLIMVIVGILLG